MLEKSLADKPVQFNSYVEPVVTANSWNRQPLSVRLTALDPPIPFAVIVCNPPQLVQLLRPSSKSALSSSSLLAGSAITGSTTGGSTAESSTVTTQLSKLASVSAYKVTTPSAASAGAVTVATNGAVVESSTGATSVASATKLKSETLSCMLAKPEAFALHISV